MSRKCSICKHEHVDIINKMLLDGTAYREITDIFSISRQALDRHRHKHIPEVLVRSYRARDTVTPDVLMKQLHEAQERIMKLSDACDDYLRDPDDPDKYRLYTRGADIWISYTVEQADGTVDYRKGKLLDLLSKLEDKGVRVFEYRIRGTDPAELAVRASKELRGYKELLGKLMGLIKDVEVNILLHPEWIQLENVLVQVLRKYPGALEEYDQKVKEVFSEQNAKED